MSSLDTGAQNHEEEQKNITTSAVPEKVTTLLTNDTAMNALKMQEDIEKVLSLIEQRTDKLNGLVNGLKTPGTEQDTLDAFLEAVGLEISDSTRYAAYMRIGSLKEDGLKNHLESGDFSEDEKDMILARARDFIAAYHMNLHEAMLETVEKEGLLTPFYRAVLRGAHNIGLAFNAFNEIWIQELILGVNRELEERFGGDQQAIMDYLGENNLFDKGHGGEIADRSYSVLRAKYAGYEKLAYVTAFPKEIQAIIDELEHLILRLEIEKDEVYGQKKEHIEYLEALKEAFSETDTDQLVAKWAKVDEKWMDIRTPFQIVHPLEFYEDKYRKAVAPEWDLRIQNTKLFQSDIKDDVESMFLKMGEITGIHPTSDISTFSLSSLNRTQLYISSPLFYYGSQLGGLPSAQVIPNDTEVSKTHGKKIFSFAENILKQNRSRPRMKLQRLAIEKGLREKKRNTVFGPDAFFYGVYDVTIIGHEFGHTLWLDMDTESRMNGGGNFKNIEEWKATTGGLIAFFMNPKEELKEAVVVDLIMRSVSLIGWMKMDDLCSYYCEGLIHLQILSDSGIIAVNEEGKIAMKLNDTTFENLKNGFIEHYKKLIHAYEAKEDASIFLADYAIIEDGSFLPKDEKIREFVKKYYALYKEIGNVVDDEE